MNLGELKEILETKDPTEVVELGFGFPHSYRGFYGQVAFERDYYVTYAYMLAAVNKALSDAFTGWKGGTYRYDLTTPVWISEEGAGWGEPIENMIPCLGK